MNTINPINNISFNARYLDMKHMEQLPPKISEAIYKNASIDEFIQAGKPKTLLGKIIDLFCKDKFIKVYYNIEKSVDDEIEDPLTKKMKKHFPKDPHAQKESVDIVYGCGNHIEKIATLNASQEGEFRKPGVIPKPGEHPLYKEPAVKAIDILVEKIKNFKMPEKHSDRNFTVYFV